MSSFQIFTSAEIDSLRQGGAILRACLEETAKHVRPGITTGELDRIAEEFIRGRGAEPGFKGYRGYPATLCISVNDETVHGIPGERELRDGDIVSLDGGVRLDGLNTDACITVPVGEVPKEVLRFLDVTKGALDTVCSSLHAGMRVGDISSAIQRYVEQGGFRCVPALTGHGLGRTLHQFPDVPNVGRSGTGPAIPAYTILAIEPITSMGSDDVRDTGDGWTLVTRDGSLSAHFEHTVLVLPEGCEVLA